MMLGTVRPRALQQHPCGCAPPLPPPLAGREGDGLDDMLWGSDYPHSELAFPQSREILTENLAGVPDVEQGQREMKKFRTGRLVARSWQIEDLPLAMELWGDPAVTALIDSRGKLTESQVREKLCAEIEREKSSGVQYWALFDHSNGDFVGCGGLRPWEYTPSEMDFEVGFHLVNRYWGKGFGMEAAQGALEYAWEKLRLSRVFAGHHPDNQASEKILKKLGFEFIENVFYKPTGLMHPSYVCRAPTARPNSPTSTSP